MFARNGSNQRRIGKSCAALCAFAGVICIAAVAGAQSAAEAAPAARPTAHLGSVFFDPLGFALFGPRLGVEAGSGRLSVAASVRWFNPALLSQAFFFGNGYDARFSYGAALRGRYYFEDGFAGAHLGVTAEYLRVHAENSAIRIGTHSQYFVPYAEVGYRLPFGQWYADASGGVGYALRVASSVENLPGGTAASSYRVDDKSSVYGTASLDLGLYF